MNRQHLYILTSIAALTLYPVYRLPLLKTLYPYLPIAMQPSYEMRRLDTFDAYSPEYASTHTYHEVFSWFRASGMENMEVLRSQVSMRGWKPLKQLH